MRCKSRIVGQRLERIRLASPFLVRSFDPPIDQANGKKVVALRRLGKRLVWELEGDLFLVIHLMIAGRFKWATDTRAAEAQKEVSKDPGKVGLAAFDFRERVVDPDRGRLQAARIAVSRERTSRSWRRTIPAASRS